MNRCVLVSTLVRCIFYRFTLKEICSVLDLKKNTYLSSKSVGYRVLVLCFGDGFSLGVVEFNT